MNESLLRELVPAVIGVLVRRGANFAAAEDADHRGDEVPQQRLVHSVTVGESARNGRTSSHS